MSNSTDTRISVSDASVIFPIYGSKSFKNIAIRRATKLFNKPLGGRINIDTVTNNVYIEALNKISIEINHGERVGLVGHNGSGKSTLLRMLAGTYPPVTGSVEVVGKIAPFLELSLGVEPDVNGYEAIYLRGLMLGLSSKTIMDKTSEIAEFSELGAFLDMPIRTYSSGMVMRLSFAISTIVNPDILLMDEWISVGDQGFQQKAGKRLNELVERSKILVIASHSIDLLKSLCTRIIRLENGQVIEDNPNFIS
ncbi:MAG: ABC transporter ATP-binding protein [Planctomycetes bacterium]|nr:ABC transporter ATP-binding protein [Planctomycetota bacterium]MCD7896121.1 ABC transporter ATP-binding protein [Planctomycetaceae bacterium]